MTIKDVIQELQRYNFDLETNVVGFSKGEVLEVKVAEIMRAKLERIKETKTLEPAEDKTDE